MNLKTWLIASILNRFSTARDIVRFAFRFFGGRVALIDRRGVFTYRQVAERALRLRCTRHPTWMQPHSATVKRRRARAPSSAESAR